MDGMNEYELDGFCAVLDTQPALGEKVAVGVLSTLAGLGTHAAGGAAGGHILANLVGIGGHHTNIGEIAAHKGMQHALTGSKLNPVSKFMMRHLMGPESLATYDAARALGDKVKDLPTEKARALLASGSLVGGLSHDVRNSPLLGDITKAVDHELKGTAPEFAAQNAHSGMLGKLYGNTIGRLHGAGANFFLNRVDTPFDSTGRRIVNSALAAAPAAALGGAEIGAGLATGAAPLLAVGNAIGSLGGHMGINAFRQRIAQSDYGKKTVYNLMQKGLRGENIGGAQQLATDVLLSPAMLDPYRSAKALHNTAAAAGPDAAKALEQVGQIPYGEFGSTMRAAVDKVKALPGQAKNVAQALTPKQPSGLDQATGALGGAAALAGAGALGYQGLKAVGGEDTQPPKPPAMPPPAPRPSFGPAPQAPTVPKFAGFESREEHEDPPEVNIFTMGGEPARRGAIVRRVLGKKVTPAHLMGALVAAHLTQKQAEELAVCAVG